MNADRRPTIPASDWLSDVIAAICEPRFAAVVLMVAFFTSLFAAYAFFSWVPLVLTSLSFPLDQAVRGALVSTRGRRRRLAQRVADFAHRLVAAARSGGECRRLVTHRAGGDNARRGPRTWRRRDICDHRGRGFRHPRVADRSLSRLRARVSDRMPHVGRRICVRAGRLGGIVSSLTGGVLLAGAGAAGFFGGVALMLVLSVVCVMSLRRHVPMQIGDDS